MSFIDDYLSFVWSVFHTPELIVSGVQRIHRDVRWSPSVESFFDGSLKLAHTGYTQNKLTALQRNYYNSDSIARAKADLRWRIDNKKYGSGAFDFRGTPKKGTKQDYCLQSSVISFYPKHGTTIQVYWRTAELVKRFRGDLLFLRDFIFPHFSEEFAIAPPFQIDFIFANVTAHPMFSILLIAQTDDWRDHFEQMRVENPRFFRPCMYWAWRYVCDTSKSVDSYSSAKQVRMIAKKTIGAGRLITFKRYVERSLLLQIDDHPDSVRQYYNNRKAAA